jgi:hypothetical protein
VNFRTEKIKFPFAGNQSTLKQTQESPQGPQLLSKLFPQTAVVDSEKNAEEKEKQKQEQEGELLR